ncbi:MAG: ATP-binding protein, partial [Thermoplasmata archaeon]|nr:ATP-binding protein [Thermoplasmata archaeon]
ENLVDADLELELPLKGVTDGKKKKVRKKVVAKLDETEDELAQEPIKGARKSGGKKKAIARESDEIILDSKLDPNITFDNYKVSDHNRIVYSIAQDIGNEPNDEFKMLYIYGSLGLGKTHLLHAIGNNIQTNDSDQNVMYIPAQEFFTNMTIALNNDKEKEFEKFFDSVKILLLDDFQDIPATKASHNMFKTILDNFLKNNKQMVLTGDRPIENIETLDKNFAKNLLIRSGMTIINLTESGIEILESLSKVRTR